MRKTQIVVATEGRDQGKTFLLRELPALRAERLAEKLFRTLVARGVEVPEATLGSGFLGFAAEWQRWLQHLQLWDLAQFLAEFDECILIRIARADRPISIKGDDIEEWSTLVNLRFTALWLHVDFFQHWQPMDFIPPADVYGLADVKNVSKIIAAAVSFDKVTLAECDTVYGLEALYMILEIISVDNHNKQVIIDRESRR
jgi:hypothetical protein